MSHINKKSLVRQVQEAYDSMLAIGRSRYFDKMLGETNDKIYSWSTYKSYMKHANYFARYCKENHNCKTLDECKFYVNEWIQYRIQEGLSSYTIKLEVSALSKLYGINSTDFIKTPRRNRKDIKRSRGNKERDKHFSKKNNKEFVEFCRSTGLRRSELKALTGNKIVKRKDKYFIIVNKGSKGGRYREAEVIGDVDRVVELMNKAGDGKVFTNIPNGADIHGYRAEYATALYNLYAREIEDITYEEMNGETGHKLQTQVYNCRNDMKGKKLDKVAMKTASRSLGHNRISIIAGNYIR